MKAKKENTEAKGKISAHENDMRISEPCMDGNVEIVSERRKWRKWRRQRRLMAGRKPKMAAKAVKIEIMASWRNGNNGERRHGGSVIKNVSKRNSINGSMKAMAVRRNCGENISRNGGWRKPKKNRQTSAAAASGVGGEAGSAGPGGRIESEISIIYQ
jgi:hypothetical protein